jgi:hypothetical protein
MLFVPEDLDTMRAAIQSWAETQSGVKAIWKKQDGPSPNRPYVDMHELTPPKHIGNTYQLNDGPALRVLSAQDDTDYFATINAVVYTYHSGIGETITQIRDALQAQITDADIVLHAYGDDIVILSSSDDADIALGATSGNVSVKIVQMFIGEAEMAMQVDVYDVQPRSASSRASALERSLKKSSVIDALHAVGLGAFDTSDIRNQDTVQGKGWEGRSGFDIMFRVTTRTVDVLDYIEDAGVITGTFNP